MSAGEEKRPLTLEEKRARVAAARRAEEEAAEHKMLDGELARIELRERLEKELGGKEGEQFAIYDATEIGEGLFAVKLAPSIVWKTYWDSALNDVDRADLVTQCIVHPSKEDYLAARSRRMGIDVVLANLLGKLNGLAYRDRQKK